MPIGSGSFSRKSSGAKSDQARSRRIDEQQFVLEECEQREVEGDADRKPDLPVLKREDQKEVGSENRDGQQRQQFRLAISVEEQAGEDQQLDLKRSQRRQVIGRKYGRGEDAELPGSESHAAPTDVGEALAFRRGRA
jgi:hypothetical protein